MAEALTLRTSELLYRTRGRDWDYCFLLQPPPLVSEGWYGLHRRIYAGVEPNQVPLVLRGALAVGLGEPFVATAFVDDTRRDDQGRPIAHYVTWLGRSAENAPGLSFGPPLIRALHAAVDEVFDISGRALSSGDQVPLDALLRQRFERALPERELTLQADDAPVVWRGTI